MNVLVERGLIQPMKCGVNFAYVLNGEIFSQTRYKLMQNQGKEILVPCVKMLFNGKTQLYYMTGNLRPLARVIGEADNEAFQKIVRNTLKNILFLQENGDLSCLNVEVSPERIFVDPETMCIKMIYLPVNEPLWGQKQEFEKKLRCSLAELAERNRRLSAADTKFLCSDLQEVNVPTSEILSRFDEPNDRVRPAKPAETGVNVDYLWKKNGTLGRRL